MGFHLIFRDAGVRSLTSLCSISFLSAFSLRFSMKGDTPRKANAAVSEFTSLGLFSTVRHVSSQFQLLVRRQRLQRMVEVMSMVGKHRKCGGHGWHEKLHLCDGLAVWLARLRTTLPS